ncbi:hypothetical protein F0U61_07945 [Archangium violaceum]|uniref:hypothetical protein n=1 Tax=Archangium violaceum TaxID=83451 RepID=UPI002B2E70F7|nr:hypothetical protein F0U61_07945 [Archangium violaceum]
MPKRSRTAVIIAGIAILATLVLLGVQTWVSTARGTMAQFLVLHRAPDGRVFVPLEDSLYVESPTGESLEVIPLSRFGVQHVEGDFAVLSDDSILLKAGRARGKAPLQRCALKSGECRQLTVEGDSFLAGVAFRLTVDEPHQRIRVSDTAQHRLLLLDFEGRILRSQYEGCRYPSSMARVAEGEYLVSDTRQARIVRISGREDNFGEELGEFSIEGWSKQPGHTRPKGIAITGDGSRWLVLTDEDISHGELYRFSGEGGPAMSIPLPEGTDTMLPEALGDSVLLPDGGLYRIHRFALDGTRMPDFGSPELKARLSGLASRATTLELLFKGSYIGLLLVTLPMLVIALWLHRKAIASEERGSGPVESRIGDDEQYRNPKSQLRQLRGESLFQRRWLILASHDARRVGLLMGVLVLLTSTVPLMLVGVMVAQRPAGDEFWKPFAWLSGLLIAMLLFTTVCVFQSQKHERLSIDARGIRYVSLFSGPLAFLARLFPGWELAWQELERITLKKAVGGGLGGAWYYELQDRSGKKRRINALSWRLVGEDEAGPTLRDVSRFSAATLQAAIHKTHLHRQLAEHLPELTSPRAGAAGHG